MRDHETVMKHLICMFCLLLVIGTVGCAFEDADGTTIGTDVSLSTGQGSGIQFKDDVETNVEPPDSLEGLVFYDTMGEKVLLSEYAGKQNVVLVFTEGWTGMLCPFCTTQTARLVANYQQFQNLDTEILVVYPGNADHLNEFTEAARTTDKGQVDKVPFPIVLDTTLEAVEFFNIKSNLAHPSTYIIDKQGRIQFAYVGNDKSADRPSVKALLRTLTAMQAREKTQP